MHGKYCLVIEIIWIVISVKLDAPQVLQKSQQHKLSFYVFTQFQPRTFSFLEKW